jgi:hypothetical protein
LMVRKIEISQLFSFILHRFDLKFVLTPPAAFGVGM